MGIFIEVSRANGPRQCAACRGDLLPDQAESNHPSRKITSLIDAISILLGIAFDNRSDGESTYCYAWQATSGSSGLAADSSLGAKQKARKSMALNCTLPAIGAGRRMSSVEQRVPSPRRYTKGELGANHQQ
jgi:hypothetical protein